MTETPTLREELDRKVIDYLANRESRRIAGEIHPEVIGIEAGAIWDVLSGLIDDDACSMLAQLAQAAPKPFVKRYFLPSQGQLALVLAHDPLGIGWLLYSQPDGKMVARKNDEAGQARTNRMSTIAQALLNNGYVEIT